LPALIKAWRIQEKVASVGFEWEDVGGVVDKVREEMEELCAEIDQEPRAEERLQDELGDLLFSVVNLARWLKINPDEALERTNRRFMERFRHIETRAQESGRSVAQLSLDEMETYWQEAKK
jgi:XTP/dITP diphosphohydrolase